LRVNQPSGSSNMKAVDTPKKEMASSTEGSA
jgi:hypothetical protein